MFRLKIFNYLVLVGFCALLIFASLSLPNRGNTQAQLNQEQSIAGTKNAATYYIKNAEKDAHTPNMVTVILADYRGFDTLGEETVILVAGLICMLILRRKRETE